MNIYHGVLKAKLQLKRKRINHMNYKKNNNPYEGPNDMTNLLSTMRLVKCLKIKCKLLIMEQ